MKVKIVICLLYLSFFLSKVNAQTTKHKPPIMGWSSWNSFRVNINDTLIREQANMLVKTGLYKVGYQYINIDDGFFGGRDSSGSLYVNKAKFPNGLKKLVQYLHDRHLKAGIYSDGGSNTCGSIWDNDQHGIGVGLYNHVDQDIDFYFKDCQFDFIKVDWCGGEKLKLHPENIYSTLISKIKAVNPDITFNICTWQFPGKWAIELADSWRISDDIRPNFKSIMGIIDKSKSLSIYSSPGHYNDMDMLQVGKGMSFEEDKTHFSMWCMLNSPLLAGNDLRHMSRETLGILSNTEVIQLNQDEALKQGKFLWTKDSVEVWEKELKAVSGHKVRAIALLNRSDSEKNYHLEVSKLLLKKTTIIRDLWTHKTLGNWDKLTDFHIPRHGIIVLRLID